MCIRDRFILLGVEIEAGDNSCADTFIVFDDGSCVQFHFLKRLGESGAEIDVLKMCIRDRCTFCP